MQSEKRRRSRIFCKKGILLKCPQGEFKGHIENISLNGALVVLEANVSLSKDMPCSLWLEVPKVGQYCIKGKVVRWQDSKIGIQFIELTPQAFSFLKTLISYYLGGEEKVIQELIKDAFELNK